MGTEIERKFLVQGDGWRGGGGLTYRQGYLSTAPERTVRVRTAGDKGYLTIKGAGQGASRLEFEYEIPLEEAGQLLEKLCHKPLIEKKRYNVQYGGFTWEVDEFFGENEGLVLAEIELLHEDQAFDRPDWLGREVTGDPRYYNASLAHYPYSRWK